MAPDDRNKNDDGEMIYTGTGLGHSPEDGFPHDHGTVEKGLDDPSEDDGPTDPPGGRSDTGDHPHRTR